MSKTKTKTLNISGVLLTKVGIGRVEANFGEDEFGDELTFVLRKPDISAIVLAAGPDEIPNFFRRAVMEMLNGKRTATGFGINSIDGDANDAAEAEEGPFNEEDRPRVKSLIRLVCDAAFSADPRYGAEGPEGFKFEDLPTHVHYWVFAWAMPREVAAMNTFPQGRQPADVGSAPDGEELRAETVGTAESPE